VESMLYMSSQSSNDGSYSLDVTFQIGTDLNLAQVFVQNRVAIAQPTLPDVVRAIGVTVKKRSPDILLVVNLYSDDDPETGKPYFGLAVFQLPGSNALDTADRVKARMGELEKRFPHGLKYTIAYDTTPFIRESVSEVFHTLRDAVILVAIVVLLFLQDWKSLL